MKVSARVWLTALGLVAVSTSLSGCPELALCGNDVLQDSEAPGGVHRAVVFSRSCGATTGYSLQISIITGSKKPSGGGNAFIGDDDFDPRSPLNESVRIRWRSPTVIEIKYPSGSKLFKRERSVDGVAVRYAPL